MDTPPDDPVTSFPASQLGCRVRVGPDLVMAGEQQELQLFPEHKREVRGEMGQEGPWRKRGQGRRKEGQQT